jgi:hypothetical protein
MSTQHVEFSDDLLTGIKALLYEVDGVTSKVVYAGVSYPVYKNVPKPPADVYVRLGQVIHDEDGTKDDFVYYGMVYLHVVYNSQLRPGKSLPKEILNVVRGLLKPTKVSVPVVTGRTVISFTPGGYNEIEEQTEKGTSVQLTDIYNFIIE